MYAAGPTYGAAAGGAAAGRPAAGAAGGVPAAPGRGARLYWRRQAGLAAEGAALLSLLALVAQNSSWTSANVCGPRLFSCPCCDSITWSVAAKSRADELPKKAWRCIQLHSLACCRHAAPSWTSLTAVQVQEPYDTDGSNTDGQSVDGALAQV